MQFSNLTIQIFNVLNSLYMIIVNNLCDLHDLYTSLSVTIAMSFNGRNRHFNYSLTYLI